MAATDRSGESHGEVFASFNAEQVKAIQKGIRDAGPAVRKETRLKLKQVGLIVANEIKAHTPVYGGTYSNRLRTIGRTQRGQTKTSTHKAGLLKASTRLKIGSLSVTVYNNAKAYSPKYPGGYRYGKRLEFDPKFTGRFAFFYKGWEVKRAEAKRAFDSVLTAAGKAYLGGS